MRLNGAAFYYDYTDKQILGNYIDLVFGVQPRIDTHHQRVQRLSHF